MLGFFSAHPHGNFLPFFERLLRARVFFLFLFFCVRLFLGFIDLGSRLFLATRMGFRMFVGLGSQHQYRSYYEVGLDVRVME